MEISRRDHPMWPMSLCMPPVVFNRVGLYLTSRVAADVILLRIISYECDAQARKGREETVVRRRSRVLGYP